MRITVLGAGAWGTALAQHASRHHEVLLWARDPQQVAALGRERRNRRYLPQIALAPSIRFSADLGEAAAFAGQGLVVVATSVAGLEATLRSWQPLADGREQGLIWVCKGITPQGSHFPHQVFDELGIGVPAGPLSGPSFAVEVARGLPVAWVVASRSPALGAVVREAFHHGAARVYTSDDVIGVEAGAALKNVIAIAAGIGDGLGLGMNARAALITRGLAEMARFGVALGARHETFMGLAGVGDLVLTCTGDASRNRTVGVRLAAGESLDEIVAALGHVAEGVSCARVAVERARQVGVELPIAEAVVRVLAGEQSARAAVAELLDREPRDESRAADGVDAAGPAAAAPARQDGEQ